MRGMATDDDPRTIGFDDDHRRPPLDSHRRPDPDPAVMVPVRMRYRPFGDVLRGQVGSEVPAEKRHREELDADTVVEWVPDRHGVRHLVGFEVLHARDRAADFERIAGLPRSLAHSAARFVTDSVIEPETPLATAIAISADSTIEIPETALQMERIPTSERGSEHDVRELAAIIEECAVCMRDLATNADPAPTRALVAALAELSSTLAAGGGLPAPGASAAARAAVRGGIPLTDSERKSLLVLLQDLDSPRRWAQTRQGLQTLLARLRSENPATT